MVVIISWYTHFALIICPLRLKKLYLSFDFLKRIINYVTKFEAIFS